MEAGREGEAGRGAEAGGRMKKPEGRMNRMKAG
jgi:hypothetical protein